MAIILKNKCKIQDKLLPAQNRSYLINPIDPSSFSKPVIRFLEAINQDYPDCESHQYSVFDESP
jgi:hypothetical protein